MGNPVLKIFLVLAVLVLTSCVYYKVLKIRSQAVQLYKEGKTVEIIPLLENALPELEKELGPEHKYIAEAYNGLAQVYAYSLNDFRKSESYFQRALKIREKTLGPEHPDTIEIISLMGFLYQVTGNFPKAETYFQRALTLREKILGPDHPDTADTQIFLGGLYLTQSKYAEAESLLLQASKNEEHKVSVRYPSPADSLISLGSLYFFLGDYERAEKFFREALVIRERELGKEHSIVALSLDSLGFLHQRKGELDKAEKYFLNSLRIKEKAFGRDHGFTGDSLINIGILYRDRKEYDSANDYFHQALEVYKKVLDEDNYRVLAAKIHLALIHLIRNEFVDTKEIWEVILASATKEQVKESLWIAQLIYGIALHKLGNNNAAIFFGKQAVNNIQEIRSALTGMEAGLQKGFLIEREEAFKFLAGLLIEEGRLSEAQQILTMIKEREHFEFFGRGMKREVVMKTTATFSQAEQPWGVKYRGINQRVAEIGKEIELLKRQKKLGLIKDESLRLKSAQQEIEVAKNAFQKFLVELEANLKNISKARASEIGEKTLDKLKAIQGTLRELGPGTVLVHYLITDEKLYLILTTHEVQLVRSKTVKSSDLNRQIYHFQWLLKNSGEEPNAQAKRLYDLMIGPIAQDLKQAKASTLMLSMDGALRYIPVSALYDGERYVAENYQTIMFTEAAQTNLLSKPKSHWTVAGLGVTKEIAGFIQLPAVKIELESIVRQGADDADGILPGVIHLDQAFTEDQMVDVLEENYPVLHIASHFVFKPGTEQDSFLLLGDGNALTLAQIRDKDLDFNNVDLLTLSACETAVGGPGANGREIEGFGWLAQRQGAKAVLATLWPVADDSTGEFMKNFYHLREKEKLSKAAALQKAQLGFIQSKIYAHPFFWAPFILMGNWL